MTNPRRHDPRRPIRLIARRLFSFMPRDLRFALVRQMIDCDPMPDKKLQLKIASSREDLAACFKLLHDAYVDSGFMKPHPSGMRVTSYHALPTTTTLAAHYDGQVVGTISMIREGIFGFPMQSAFDLTPVRALGGRIAEISALAVHPDFRKTGGAILFPLMKFMYEYCRDFFDTRHLVIAVNPNRIEMYEALLFFHRLRSEVVQSYDFANGAPAVGAALDLHAAPEIFRTIYDGRRPRKNLYDYFTKVRLPNIAFPDRRYYTTNDPVMTPEMLDYFFNQATDGFSQLDDRQRRLLHEIYHEDDYRAVLPALPQRPQGAVLRRQHRYSLRCPAHLRLVRPTGPSLDLDVVDISMNGFLAQAPQPLPEHGLGEVSVQLGAGIVARNEAEIVRRVPSGETLLYGFKLEQPCPEWRRCVSDLEARERLESQATLQEPLAQAA